LRGATFIIESGDKYILIDPMLSDTGVIPAFARFRHAPLKNPLVPLPDNAATVLGKVTHCLMPMEEMVEFVRTAPHRVIANHLEALNHCPATREQPRRGLEREGLLAKVIIPAAGETIEAS